LVTTNAGPAYLFHNQEGVNHSLRVKLRGTESNRDGIGAAVHMISDQDKQWQMVRSGSGYLSQSELILTFGLGMNPRADSLEIHWPSGHVDKLSNINGGQTVTVTEGKGVTSSRPYQATKRYDRKTAGNNKSASLLRRSIREQSLTSR
jgi:hypothetical protein